MSLKLFPKKPMVLFTLTCFTVLVFPVSNFAGSSRGKLTGFVYGEDGKSPLQDAVVSLKGVATDKVYQSKPTGKTGDYRIADIDAGAYVVGLNVNEKTFNVDGFVNVADGKTDTLSLALESPPGPEETLLDEQQGWCCLAGKVFKRTGEECTNSAGAFFATKKEAQKQCGIPSRGFFTSPSGIALLIAGTTAVFFGINKLAAEKEEKEVSPTER